MYCTVGTYNRLCRLLKVLCRYQVINNTQSAVVAGCYSQNLSISGGFGGRRSRLSPDDFVPCEPTYSKGKLNINLMLFHRFVLKNALVGRLKNDMERGWVCSSTRRMRVAFVGIKAAAAAAAAAAAEPRAVKAAPPPPPPRGDRCNSLSAKGRLLSLQLRICLLFLIVCLVPPDMSDSSSARGFRECCEPITPPFLSCACYDV